MRDSGHRRSRRKDRESQQARSDSPAQSDSTIDLPERFDRDGRPRPQAKNDDSIADKIEDLLAGKTTPGKLFKGLAANLLGGGSGGGGGGGGGGGSGRDR